MDRQQSVKKITDDIFNVHGFPRNWLRVVERCALEYEGVYELLQIYYEESDGFETLEIIKDIIQIVEEVR